MASRKPIPLTLSDDTLLFSVPEKMVKVFNRDIAFAGIPKRDSRDRTLDLHALRHTFGTMLAKSGASLQVAQRAMRHSDPKLTANIYTHLGLLDVSGAIQAIRTMNRKPKSETVAKVENAHNDGTGNGTGDNGKTCTKGAFFGSDTVKGFNRGVVKENPAFIEETNKNGGNSMARSARFERATPCSGGKEHTFTNTTPPMGYTNPVFDVAGNVAYDLRKTFTEGTDQGGSDCGQWAMIERELLGVAA